MRGEGEGEGEGEGDRQWPAHTKALDGRSNPNAKAVSKVISWLRPVSH